MESVVCDASSLISLSSSCYLNVLKLFKQKIQFIIPKAVEYECIIKPRSIKQFSLNSFKLSHLVKLGIITITEEDQSFLKDIMDTGNNIYYKQGKPIHLIDKGECGMIAYCIDRKVNYMLIDERTTRALIEAPHVLKKHFEKEFNVHITTNIENLEKFREMTKNINVLRSSELLILAYKKGYFDDYENPKKMLESSLNYLKYSGCALSFEEIDQFIKTLK
ncbi:hypothetical protein KO465_08550 [Candidatus Micrarchaeota archaeon]|nr:hypothetical protein [Candidatus Micrarchaeota archaeon]